MFMCGAGDNVDRRMSSEQYAQCAYVVARPHGPCYSFPWPVRAAGLHFPDSRARMTTSRSAILHIPLRSFQATGIRRGEHVTGSGCCMRLLAVFVGILASGASTARAQDFAELTERTPAAQKVFHKALASVVWVNASRTTEEGGTENRHRGGVLVDLDHRLVITTYDGIPNEAQVVVLFARFEGGLLVNTSQVYADAANQGKAIPAKIVLRDPTRDLTLLQLDSVPPDAKAIKLARGAPKPQQLVLSVSTIFDSREMWVYRPERVVDAGPRKWTDDVADKTLNIEPHERKARVIESEIFYTNSQTGGALVNERGDLLGMLTPQPPTVNAAPSAATSLAIDVKEIRTVLSSKEVRAITGKRK